MSVEAGLSGLHCFLSFFSLCACMMDERAYYWMCFMYMHACMHGWMDGWMDGCGWMWMDVYMYDAGPEPALPSFMRKQGWWEAS